MEISLSICNSFTGVLVATFLAGVTLEEIDLFFFFSPFFFCTGLTVSFRLIDESRLDDKSSLFAIFDVKFSVSLFNSIRLNSCNS